MWQNGDATLPRIETQLPQFQGVGNGRMYKVWIAENNCILQIEFEVE